jgi:hypothetical protein
LPPPIGLLLGEPLLGGLTGGRAGHSGTPLWPLRMPC